MRIAIIHLWDKQATLVTDTMYVYFQITENYMSLKMLALNVVIFGNASMGNLYSLWREHSYYIIDSSYLSFRTGDSCFFRCSSNGGLFSKSSDEEKLG